MSALNRLRTHRAAVAFIFVTAVLDIVGRRAERRGAAPVEAPPTP